MNSMKKIFRKYGVIISCFILVGLVLTILFIRSPKLALAYYPTHYSLLNNSESWEVEVYANQRNSYYFNVANITSARILSANCDTIYKVSVIDITRNKESRKFKDDKYYSYRLQLSFPVGSKQLESISQAYLQLGYFDQEINIQLGDFSLMTSTDTLNISIDVQKGIINQNLNAMETMVAMIVKLTNNEADDLVLSDIIAVSSSVVVDLSAVRVLDHYQYEPDTDLKIIMNEQISKDEIIIGKQSSIILLIPFNYQRVIYIDKMGLVLKFNQGVKNILPITLFRSLENEVNIIFQAYDFY